MRTFLRVRPFLLMGVTAAVAAAEAVLLILVRPAPLAIGLALAVSYCWMVILLMEMRRLHQRKLLAERANKAKGHFLANVGEELRVPMNGIVGMTDLLLGSGLTPVQSEYARSAKTSAAVLMKNLDDVLQYTRILDGQVTFAKVDFEFHELMETLVERYVPQASEKGLQMACHVSPNVPEVLRGDPVQLQNIVNQILGNAMKYTERGGICLRARCLGETKEGFVVHIEVSDTGRGIAEHEHARVFDSFVRDRKDNSGSLRKGDLGLAVARQIVTRVNGVIGFHSEPDRGSSFWVVLPFARPELSVPPVPRDTSLQGKTALVLARTDCLRAQLCDYLGALGITPIAIEHEQDLVNPARNEAPADVVLVDEPAYPAELAPLLGKTRLILLCSAPPTLPKEFLIVRKPVRRRTLEHVLTIPRTPATSSVADLQQLAQAVEHTHQPVRR